MKFKNILLLFSIAGSIGLGLFFYLKQKNENGFEYISPHRGTIIESVYGLGKVKTNQFFEAKIGMTRVVRKLFVKEGQTVKKGQALVALDESAQFFAPFDGTVTLVAFREAQTVYPQQTIVRLENMKDLYIEVSLEQNGALRIQKGQSAIVLFESLRNNQYKGYVESIFPQSDDFLTHIQVENLTPNILPGMTADVAIEVGRHENALLIPLTAVSNGRVILEKNGKRVTQAVAIGQTDQNWAEVTDESLQESDKLIVKRR